MLCRRNCDYIGKGHDGKTDYEVNRNHGKYTMRRVADETQKGWRQIFAYVREVQMEQRGLGWVGIKNMRSQNRPVDQEVDKWCLEKQPAV